MIIKDLFKKEIDRSIQGVVTIGNEDEEQKWQELEEYVCTDEITKSFRTFFRRYRESISVPTEKMGVWITGFFGSGKSHFLKILGYLLENDVVAGVHAVDYFDEKIKDQLVLADIKQCAKANNKVVLFNIDSKAKSDSKNKSQAIMDIMLRAFNESIGYCGSSPWVADLERTLDSEKLLEAFITKFEELSGRMWIQTRTKALLNRDYIVKALVEVRGMTSESAKQFIDGQTKNFTNTTEDFAKIVNEYCRQNKVRVVFLMDEVGQFIGTNGELMLNLQTCVEDLGKYCRGQAWVVVTSQQELKAMIESTKAKQNDFSKIQGRFDTRLLLSGANADEVIKKRILEKKESARTPLMSLYEANASKLSNLILFEQKPTWSGYKDANEFQEVYPFVSYQFELLQKVFESIRESGMSEGRHLSQNERSLLSAFQESAKKIAASEVGILVPFDSFYQTIEQFIDYDIKTVFSNAERRGSLDSFAIRVLRVLFMIKHVKEMPATINRLATMMVESINEDKAALKDKIYEALKILEEETLIQKNGEEYDFLTNAEQDVNKQINSIGHNEGEVQRNILEIVYDKVLDSNKLRYENRYDFALNRFVDQESKGSFSQDNITIKIFTDFSDLHDPASFAAESARTNAVVVDMTAGSYIDELINANKIATFKRNNSATMSVALTEIMSKKSAEYSERLKRAEDIIRQVLRTAPIYLNGTKLDIKEKDAKDRLTDALRAMVKQDYYKLDLVSCFYSDQKAISEVLDDGGQSFFATEITDEANYPAYKEIIEKIKNDKSLGRRITVKGLVEHFSKKPYGWRELDVLGMVANLWKKNVLQIVIHEVVVDDKNRSFKMDFARKNGLDTMILRIQEKIDDAILYKVKRIMQDAYDENIPLDETKLKEGVISFFENKRKFLSDLKAKYGSDYAGVGVATEIYRDFDAILRSSDTLTIFNEVIAREDSLKDKAEQLEQLESFYRAGSNQQKNYKDAIEIAEWYRNNYMFNDLSALSDVIIRINDILSMKMPFGKMTELASLVFEAREVKTKILEDKCNVAKKRLEEDRTSINKELREVLNTDIAQERKDKIQEAADELNKKYDNWLSSLQPSTPNIEAYITSSHSQLEKFREFIATAIIDGTKPNTRSKRVKIIECVPVANKKIKSADDVEKVLAAIKDKLLKELGDSDEINLD